jgi:CubicO group peptidase (beta-lactamase class C family)
MLPLVAVALASCTAGEAAAAVAAPQEPDKSEMRAAMQEYLLSRNLGSSAGRPRYLDATRIHRFQKRECRPAQPAAGVVCGYFLETGTTYREVRLSSHRFERVDGRWVSRGPVRPPASTVSGSKPTTPASTNFRLEEKRALVEKARADDLFFWQRYLRRLENPGEFPQPDSFYVPSQLLEGDASPPLPPARPRNRRVSEAHWDSALQWAKAHDTEVLAVARDGHLEFAWFGPGRDGGSLLPVRSIAKPLTALAVGAAIADGRIKTVQQPIGDFLEPWRNDARGRITLEQLLTMSSGLNSFPPDPAPLGLTLQLAEGSDIRGTALAHSLVAGPGTRYAWGNVESQLLAMSVESATGMSYRDYLQARIWKPLGLGTASLNVDRDGQTRAFCCLRIRADDLLKIGLMLVNGGEWQGRRILPAEWVTRMFSPSAINPYHGYQAFLGWTGPGRRLADPPFIQRHDVPFSEPAWYLSGYGGTTTLWMLPCSGLVVLRWGNDPKEWETSTIPNLLLTGSANPIDSGAARRPTTHTDAASKPWLSACKR